MGFVFVLRNAAHRGRANQLAKALRSRGLDVCVGLEKEPADVRAAVSRSLVDHCAATTALWTDADLEDASFIEPMRYAASRGKLVAVSLGGGQLPANLSPNADVAHAWPGDAAALAALCDAVANMVSRTLAPNEWAAATAFTASEEYAALVRMHKQRSVEAMARFLREFPGGMFEDIVRAELDAATRPEYEPESARRRGLFGAGDGAAENEPAQVWRMGGPLSALENLDPRWLWGGAAAVGAAALAFAAFNFMPALPIGGDASRAQSEQSQALADAAGSRVRIGPAEVRAGPLDPATAPETEASAAVDAAADALELAQAEEEAAADQPLMLNDAPAPVQPAALHPSAVTNDTAPLADPPSTQLLRVPEPEASRVVRDTARLDPVARNAVERARRSEAAALAAAAARTSTARIVVARPNTGAGLYHGEWADNAAHGLGRAVWGNGDWYAGSWRGSAPHGYGVLVLASGMQYEGEFSAGAPTGRGAFWGEDGRRLTGDRLFAALVSARTR